MIMDTIEQPLISAYELLHLPREITTQYEGAALSCALEQEIQISDVWTLRQHLFAAIRPEGSYGGRIAIGIFRLNHVDTALKFVFMPEIILIAKGNVIKAGKISLSKDAQEILSRAAGRFGKAQDLHPLIMQINVERIDTAVCRAVIANQHAQVDTLLV